MIVPESNLRTATPIQSARTFVRFAVFALIIASIGWVLWVESQIHYFADRDEARPADAIAVFGAAEYDGRPSPVLRARLDHGLKLYQEKLAHSEGGVGHDYLMAHGVPDAAIIAETESSNTEESAKRLAVIARANGLHRIVVVSDGTHLFRIHALCASQGLDVVTSPRPVARPVSRLDVFERTAHEIMSYTVWRLRAAVGARL
jgi:uncharacterized SAM-binding protein YcdF (DUF218 family)